MHTLTVGSVLTGWPFAYVIETYSWNEGYWLIEMCSATMCVLCVYLVTILVRGIQRVDSKK